MLSQFYILSPRGDTIISREYRADCPKGTSDIFFHASKFWDEDSGNSQQQQQNEAPPCFHLDGVNYIYIKQNGLFFVATTKYNVSPNFVLELLNRLAKLFKDYCGVLSEESIRKNFIMIYELLDEVVDYGYPQCSSTEQLKVHVHNEPVVVDMIKQTNALKIPSVNQKTTPSSSVYKPVTLASKSGQQRNEIFVDILERLTMLFSHDGYILASKIDGCIQMKSYLYGNPPLRLALNEDLVVGKLEGTTNYGAVILDDCNFHDCVNLEDFESLRTLNFVPPDGEFVLMNYRVTGDFVAPFRIYPFIEEVDATQIEVVVKIRADLPQNNFGANVQVSIPVPKKAIGVSTKIDDGNTTTAAGQSAEYRTKDNKVLWTIKKFQGGMQHIMRAKIALKEPYSPSVRREIGPVGLTFEIPMFNASNLQVKYLRVVDQQKTYSVNRWVRYVTNSNAYEARFKN